MNLIKAILGAAIGATPGVILFLLVEFVIKGEWQLTIAVLGLMVLAMGSIAGFAVGWSRSAKKPGPRQTPS
jgi:hypothetical protein